MVAAVMKVLHNVEDDYPAELKREIVAAVGKLDHIEIWGEEVLVAPFVQPHKSKGGILMAGSKTNTEDKWQGKSFLILKLGTKAQKIADLRGADGPKVGDWCFGMPQESDHLSISGEGAKAAQAKDNDGVTRNKREWGAGWPCRLVLIGDIRGRTTRPQDIM